MITHLVKWGGSIGIRLPKVFLEDLNFKDGTQVEIVKNGSELCIRPAKKKLELKLKYQNNFTLEELVADMTPENCRLEDWESAKPVGKEIW